MSPTPFFRISVILAVLLLVPGCRSAAPERVGQRLGPIDPGPRTSSTSDVLSAIEIASAAVADAHEAVVRFRPEFLRGRAAPGVSDPEGSVPVVYVNGVRQGGIDMLRTIPARTILEIRYLSPTLAAEQFGSFYVGGVLAVRTLR